MSVVDNTGMEYLPFCLEGFQTKYALKDPQTGELLEKTPSEALKRVAEALSVGMYAPYRQDFINALQRGGVPAGRIMANAGSPYKRASLINCTVSRTIDDSMDGIFTAVKEAALTLSSGSGIGYCFSTLRPTNAPVTGVGAYSSGPLSFMAVFDATCKTVFAGGGRRGAQMGTFWVYHPDIFEFITAKKQEGFLRSMNVSVMVDQKFMDAVKNDTEVELIFPKLKNDPADSTYIEEHFPGYVGYSDVTTLRVYKRVRAREIWDAIMQSTYETSEPGILFYDRMNQLNPLCYEEDLIATNPCGEQVLPPFGACNLGSMNLTAYLNFNDGKYWFDHNAFQKDVTTMHILLDAVCDQAQLALPQQSEEILLKRRHGLGIMGLGSTLALLNLPYDVTHLGTRGFCDIVGKTLVRQGFLANVELARESYRYDQAHDIPHQPFLVSERLEAYLDSPYWRKHNEIIPRQWTEAAKPYGLRFSHATAIAPTGTIALFLGNNISNGIEPTFRHEYIRNIKVAGRKTLKDTLITSYEYRRYKQDFGQDAPLPESFKESHEIAPEHHIRMQSLFQHYMDSSISKTINVPYDISYDNFKAIYQSAFALGCKGCTTFRFNPEIFHGVLISPKDLERMTYAITLKDGTQHFLKGNDRVYLLDIDEDAPVANLVSFIRKET